MCHKQQKMNDEYSQFEGIIVENAYFIIDVQGHGITEDFGQKIENCIVFNALDSLKEHI